MIESVPVRQHCLVCGLLWCTVLAVWASVQLERLDVYLRDLRASQQALQRSRRRVAKLPAQASHCTFCGIARQAFLLSCSLAGKFGMSMLSSTSHSAISAFPFNTGLNTSSPCESGSGTSGMSKVTASSCSSCCISTGKPTDNMSCAEASCAFSLRKSKNSEVQTSLISHEINASHSGKTSTAQTRQKFTPKGILQYDEFLCAADI